MAAKVIDVKSFSPKGSDVFFFDNNIWMYLFCPLGNYKQSQQKYFSQLFNDILTVRSTLYTTSLIVSEFANRYLRLDFELWVKLKGTPGLEFKKDFVGTSRYRDTVADVSSAIEKIISKSTRYPDNFSSIDLSRVLEHFSVIDFNDSYFIENGLKTNWKLVTDDKDFIKYQGHNLTIVTFL